jgi:hypothetical protein
LNDTDVVYYNYTAKGISLQFTPVKGYKPARTAKSAEDLDQNRLELSTIDIYSKQYGRSDSQHPIIITYASPGADSPDKELELTRETTGKELVAALGEPDRKGGGESRSVGVWLEWTGLGIMVEFSGVHGSQRWDVEHGAGNSLIGVLSIFQPGEQKGASDD